MPDVISFQDFQERKALDRMQDALGMLYVEILQQLNEERHSIDPTVLESFLINAIADHLMVGFRSTDDINPLANRYSDFEARLRQAIYQRISEFDQPF